MNNPVIPDVLVFVTITTTNRSTTTLSVIFCYDNNFTISAIEYMIPESLVCQTYEKIINGLATYLDITVYVIFTVGHEKQLCFNLHTYRISVNTFRF